MHKALLPILALFAGAPVAQAPLPIDEDPAALPVTTLTSNATHSRRNTTALQNAHAVRNVQVITQRQIVVSNCDLLVDGDGHLRLENCWLRVQGDVFLKDRGVLELIDCRVQLENTFPKQFNYWFEGGELRTTRCAIGGRANAAGSSQVSVFNLNRGLWRAVDTTVQYSGGIQLGLGRAGWSNDPFLRGGSLYANGLHQGVDPDSVIASGYGDIVLENSVFSLNLSLYADSGQVAHTAIDFRTNQVIPLAIYGDASLLDSMPLSRPPVTNDVPGLPYRLQLVNSVVPFWTVGIYEVATTGPRHTFELQDPTGLSIGIHAEDLQGSPAAIGPWSTYTTRIPQLPCVGPGGADPIPPGCGVRIGNVDLVAPANRPTRVTAWAFYLEGINTNFAISGPTRIAEIAMHEGQLTITGSEAYDARVSANTIHLHRDALLTLDNVSIGRFEEPNSQQRYLELQGVSSCIVTRALINGLQVRSVPERFWGPYLGVEAGTFQISDFIELANPLDAVATGQSTFSVQRATPTQSFDLTNVNMDLPPVGGTPSHWAATGLSATPSNDTRPATASSASNELLTLGSTASMAKSIAVVGGCFVDVRAWIKPVQTPPGASLQLRVTGAQSGTTTALVTLAATSSNNGWRQVVLPPHPVHAQDGPLQVEFSFVGTGLRVRIDDVMIRPTLWWDADSLANLDFDDSNLVGYSFPPTELRHPAYWKVWNCNASIETAAAHPNATAGTRGTRLDVTASEASLYKVLSDLAPGTTITVTGWMRIVAPQQQALKVHVGDESRWWDPNHGANQWAYVHDARTWTQFTVPYTVPASVPNIRICITGGVPGNDILVDDLVVTLQ